MGYDDVIPLLGGFGKYQKRIYFLVCLPAISCAFHKLAGVFLLSKPDYRCMRPFENESTPYSLSMREMDLSYPIDPRSTNKKWMGCEYFDANYTDSLYLQSNTSKPPNKTRECDSWIFDTPLNQTSTVTEWNMVCGKSWLTATSDSLFMLGVMLGSIIFGDLSDRYGRRPIFFLSLVIQVIFGILAGIAPEYITYTISRLIIGATTSGVFLVAYVLALEMVGPEDRLNAGMIIMMFFSLGFVLLAGLAYYIVNWRWLQIALTLPGLGFLCYWWFIPESARWLLSKNRKDEAIATIQKAAKVNKVNLPTSTLETLLGDEGSTDKKTDEKQATIIDVFRHPNLRRKAFFIFFDWFVVSGTYYGLSWNTSNLGGNVLLNFVIMGAVEFPAYTFLMLTLNRYGRRTILCGSMIIAGIFLLLTAFVPEGDDLAVVTITLAMLGKLAITASYGTIYIFSAEQFPTVIRNVGMGAASTAARVGGILAPYFNLLGEVWKPLPLITFGALAFIGGVASASLPETHNKTLPITIADGEAFGKRKRSEDDVTKEDELKPLANDENKVNGVVVNETGNKDGEANGKY